MPPWSASCTPVQTISLFRKNHLYQVAECAAFTSDMDPAPCQDADALEAARNCKLPEALLSLSDLNSKWATDNTALLDTCAKSTGIPTATQVKGHSQC